MAKKPAVISKVVLSKYLVAAFAADAKKAGSIVAEVLTPANAQQLVVAIAEELGLELPREEGAVAQRLQERALRSVKRAAEACRGSESEPFCRRLTKAAELLEELDADEALGSSERESPEEDE